MPHGNTVLEELQKANRDTPADYPPELAWEQPLWDLLMQFRGVWKVGFGGREGLDMPFVLSLTASRGWREDVVLELCAAIEAAEMAYQDEQRKADQQNNG